MRDVAAALIWRTDEKGNKRFMICQRPRTKARGLLWEFVGGKREEGETLEQTLVRECREELGVSVKVGKLFFRVQHEYPDITIALSLFEAQIAEGEPKLLEHEDLRWITPEEIDKYEFCPADVEILKRIKADF